MTLFGPQNGKCKLKGSYNRAFKARDVKCDDAGFPSLVAILLHKKKLSHNTNRRSTLICRHSVLQLSAFDSNISYQEWFLMIKCLKINVRIRFKRKRKHVSETENKYENNQHGQYFC